MSVFGNALLWQLSKLCTSDTPNIVDLLLLILHCTCAMITWSHRSYIISIPACVCVYMWIFMCVYVHVCMCIPAQIFWHSFSIASINLYFDWRFMLMLILFILCFCYSLNCESSYIVIQLWTRIWCFSEITFKVNRIIFPSMINALITVANLTNNIITACND